MSRIICSICGIRLATMSCRRCGRKICYMCHFGHGLCIECSRSLRRSRIKTS